MKTSNIGKLISNYGSRFWSLVSVFIFIPIYINLLGIENYAIIGFYSLLLGVISFADAGMSSAIIKEFAVEHTALYKYSVLRRVENLYLTVCFIIMLVIVFSSHFIAKKWLISDQINLNDLAYYISLIGIGITIQLLSSLYFGSLFGLNEQIKANSYQVIWNLAKSGLIILVMMYHASTLEIYFIWQIVCNIVYVLVLRTTTIVILKKETSYLKNNLKAIPPDVLKYIGGMTIISLISSINSQADKIITSLFFSLKIFGYYNIASTISQIPVILGSPLVIFIFPLLSKFSENQNEEKLNISFKKISYLLNLIIYPTAILLILYTSEIIKLWTGDTIDIKNLPPILLVIKFLTTGSLFLAMQFPLYYFLLSKGKTKYTIYQGLIQVIFGLPILYLCTKYIGLEAIGFPWILINLGSLIFLTVIVFKKYMTIHFVDFSKEIIIIPLIISLFICLLMFFLFKLINQFFYIFAGLSGMLSIFLTVIYSNYQNKRSLTNIKDLYDFPN